MKETIISEIQIRMMPVLTNAQLIELKNVLVYCLQNVEFKAKDGPEKSESPKNEHLVNTFLAAKGVEGCSDKSLKYYKSTIQHMLTFIAKAVRNITTEDLRLYLTQFQQQRGSSKVTIDNIRRIFSSFFSWLEDEDYIIKSPVRRIHRIKTDKVIKETFSDECLEVLRDICTNKRDLAMIDILVSTGMRVGELVRLNRDDINFQERECIVFGKGNTERMVYFDARTKIHLQEYLQSRKDSNPALFVSLSKSANRLLIGGVETRLRKLGALVAVQPVYPHKFRRTFATRAIDKGMPIEQVQKLLGHVKIETTMHYAMVNQTNIKIAHRKFIG